MANALGHGRGAALLAVLCALALAPAASAQDAPTCRGAVFSIEEEFLSRGPTPPDGNPLVSAGDLLARDPGSGGVRVCARNRDLVGRFDVREDLGIDAVDVIDPEKRLIAFSTELDSPHGNFGHGDLLATNGAVIPASVLLQRFRNPRLRDNVGLDGVHFVGRRDGIVRLLEAAREIGRDGLRENPERLLELLKQGELDIWISIEGTAPTPDAPAILDGDVLSVMDGSKVVAQDALLDPPVPAGIPKRGVDFGLDALTGDRAGNREAILFSTEILFRDEPAFTDGDVLRIGGSIVLAHEALIRPLEPAADFAGLDALSLERAERADVPNIQTLCGDRDVVDFDGGRVPVNAGGTGLWRADSGVSPPGEPPRRPCGAHVPIDGFLPDSDVRRFRIAYRPAGTPAPAPGDTSVATGIVTKWRLRGPHPVYGWCSSSAAARVALETDAEGWMNAQDYRESKLGTVGGHTDGCSNGGLQLAVWDTAALPASERDGHHVVWLEWEDSGGTLHRRPYDHHIQLDNTRPQIAAYPGGLQVKLADGSGRQVPACGEAPTGVSEFQVWAQFADDYYHGFRLTVEGGDPPTAHAFESADGDTFHAYFEPHDGTAGLKNTDPTGTTPDLTTVHLRDIDMNALGEAYKRCCYLLRLRVFDAAIRHGFNGRYANPIQAHEARAFVTFEAGG
jgi:hypothetical protein